MPHIERIGQANRGLIFISIQTESFLAKFILKSLLALMPAFDRLAMTGITFQRWHRHQSGHQGNG